jgi:hypothetical protein
VRALNLFYSYSHKDEGYKDSLETHLKLLEREGIIKGWSDRKISFGSEWKGEIDQRLEEADIILLLISADFIASDYCFDKELGRALERHRQNEAKVVPVIIRPTDWKSAPFAALQVLPKDGKPVIIWPFQDEAWENIAEGIRRVAQELRQGVQAAPSSRKIIFRVKSLPNEIHCVFDSKADLGRSRQCDFCFTQAPASVSNYHARISYSKVNRQFFIQDLESSNGTYVDGVRLTAASVLRLGTRVSLGQSLPFLFSSDERRTLPSGALIFNSSSGKEVARYLLAPAGEIRLGNRPGDEAPLPVLPKGLSVARILSRADGFYFLPADREHDPAAASRLENGVELDLDPILLQVEILA